MRAALFGSGSLLVGLISQVHIGGTGTSQIPYRNINEILKRLGIVSKNYEAHQNHFHIYLRPPAPVEIQHTASLLAYNPPAAAADSAPQAATPQTTAPALQTEAQGLLDYAQAITNTGDELMFTMDVPYVPVQDTPIVLAQAATPGAGSTPQPDYLLKECQEIESTGNPRSAGRAVDPAYMLANFLDAYSNGKQIIDWAAMATIKPVLLQDTTHGKIISGKTNDNGRTVFHYEVEPNYIGKDKAIFMVEFEGKRYKMVINFVVSLTVGESDSPPLPGEEVCPLPKLIKINGKPVSGSLSSEQNVAGDLPSRLNLAQLDGSVAGITVTLANLPGGAVGQDSGTTSPWTPMLPDMAGS